ncbi:PAS domain S-box protein, partial [Shimia sp.]|uniref:PAS domain S-box protein n=1 Tax=Shimia sp. TaxID=1954381 RepID=UPI0035627398
MFESTLQDLPWTAILLLIAIALLAYRNILTGVRLKTLKQAIDQHAIYSRTDAKGVIRDVNTNFEKVSGYNRDELIGQDHRMLNSGYHEGTFFDRMW